MYAHATHCVPHEAVLTPKHSTESAVTPTRARPGFGDSTALARRWLAERVDLLHTMSDLALIHVNEDDIAKAEEATKSQS